MSTGHRKQVRHYDKIRLPHELTFSCYKRMPLLDDESRRLLLARSIDAATQKQAWRLAAFVFMPEHVHLLVYPTTTEARISELLFAIKRPFSYRVKQELKANSNPLLDRLTIRQRPGVTTFRFWQEGPGYDRNLNRERALVAAIDYLHANPVRRGLVGRPVDYKWSSARWYACETQEVDPDLPRLSKLPPECFPGVGDQTR